MPFCVAKGHLLHIKRACFAMQKGTFYNAKEHRLKAGCDIILHKPRSISVLLINLWVEISRFVPCQSTILSCLLRLFSLISYHHLLPQWVQKMPQPHPVCAL